MGTVITGSAKNVNIGARGSSQIKSNWNNLTQQALNKKLSDAGNENAQADIDEANQQGQESFNNFGQGGDGGGGGDNGGGLDTNS